MERALGCIYKYERIRVKRKNQEPNKWICDRFVASIVGGSLMKVRNIPFKITNDVMAVYKIYAEIWKKKFSQGFGD